MAPNRPPMTDDGDDDVPTIETLEEAIQISPLVRVFGDHPRTRFLDVLLEAHPRPLSVTAICEHANVNSRQTWYNHVDELKATGMVVEISEPGERAVRYTVPDPSDDQRTEWLEKLQDWTAAYINEHAGEEA